MTLNKFEAIVAPVASRSHKLIKLICLARLGCAFLLTLFAVSCALMAVDVPRSNRKEQDEQLAKLQRFKVAAAFTDAYMRQTGAVPSEEEITSKVEPGLSRIGVVGPQTDGSDLVGCAQEEFDPDPNDRFMLSAWNGNGFHCYAFPSGKTNIHTGLPDPRAGIVTFGILSLLFALCAWAFWPNWCRAENYGNLGS